MILAGIDEAGYGPVLGPLVVGCCAFEAKPDPGDSPPCLWTRLRSLVSRTRTKSGRKLHINDSKAVYSPSNGLKELERSVLSLAGAWQEHDDSLSGFIERVAPHVNSDLRTCPWYSLEIPFPIEADRVSVQIMSHALRAEMAKSGLGCVHLAARVVLEREFNRMLDATRNKGSTLFSITAIHLDYLVRSFGQRNLMVVIDRQGGREHYGHLLRQMFEDWELEILSEQPARSLYAIHRAKHRVRLAFCEKAEAQSMPVAIASMLSKYLREALMRRFNAFWKTHVPGLSPTAGYYVDGLRFLRDIQTKRRELGICDDLLVRSR